MSSIPLKRTELESLKVKRVNLAQEGNYIRLRELHYREDAKKARIKRKLERSNAFDATRISLYQHRRDVVRPEARAANIAHAYLKGYKYEHVENSFVMSNFGISYKSAKWCHDRLWERVCQIVSKFGNIPIEEVEVNVIDWRNEHVQYSGVRKNIEPYRNVNVASAI
jgi:hypothetical protein